MKIDEILDTLGFSSYKKKAYVALIDSGTAGAVSLSRKTGIPSSKIYEVMQWLYENGYVSIISQKPLVYKANDPKKVLGSDVRMKIDELKKIQAGIRSLKHMGGGLDRCDFEVVYGKDAFYRKVKDAVSRSNKSNNAIVRSWKLDAELKELTSDLVKRGGKVRLMGPSTPKRAIAEWESIGVETKFINPESTRFTVWDGKIVTIGFKDQGKRDYYSLWFENETLGKIFDNWFFSMWDRI